MKWADIAGMGHMIILGSVGFEWWGSAKPAAMWTKEGRCFVPFVLGIWFELKDGER